MGKDNQINDYRICSDIGIKKIEGESYKVNSIIEFKGTMFIGTDKGLYYLDEETREFILVKEKVENV